MKIKKSDFITYITFIILIIIFILIILILSLILFICLLELNEILNGYLIFKEVIKTSLDITLDNSIKVCTNTFRDPTEKNIYFELFIKYFNKTNSYSYFPSYFISTDLKVKYNDFALLEYIINNQYIMLAHKMECLNEFNITMNDILNEYQSIRNTIK